MAESTFNTPSTLNIDSIEVDISSPIDSQVIVYNGTKFVSAYHVPVGTIEMWGGLSTNIPYGWLLCDGQQISSSSALGAVLSTRYNTGGESAGNVRVPNMSAVIPMGITSGANAGTTNFSYPAANVAHTHASFTSSTANTNSDGTNHSHNYADGGSHNHSTSSENFSHTHNTNAPSNTHTHNTQGANAAFANTGFTAHLAQNHGNTNSDSGLHSHATGNQNANHSHNVSGNSNSNSHTHNWPGNATSQTTATAGSHNHTVTVVSICFIIKS